MYKMHKKHDILREISRHDARLYDVPQRAKPHYSVL